MYYAEAISPVLVDILKLSQYTSSSQYKGACTYDVCTGRGEGGPPKADGSTDKLHECDSDKGGGGSKNQKNLQTSYVHAPLLSLPSFSISLRAEVKTALQI